MSRLQVAIDDALERMRQLMPDANQSELAHIGNFINNAVPGSLINQLLLIGDVQLRAISDATQRFESLLQSLEQIAAAADLAGDARDLAQLSADNAAAAAINARNEIIQSASVFIPAYVYGAINGNNKIFNIIGIDLTKSPMIFVDGLVLNTTDYTYVGNVVTFKTAPASKIKAYGEIHPLDIAPAGYNLIRFDTVYNGVAARSLSCTMTGGTAKWRDDAGVETTATTYALTQSPSCRSVRLLIPSSGVSSVDVDVNNSAIVNTFAPKLIPLRNLTAHNNNISDLTNIAALRPIGSVHFSNNQITDLSPIANWRPTGSVYFHANQITDLSPIANWRPTGSVHFYVNQITDLSPIANWRPTGALQFDANKITNTDFAINFAALTACSLIRFDGGTNAAPTTAACTDIASILARGATLLYNGSVSC